MVRTRDQDEKEGKALMEAIEVQARLSPISERLIQIVEEWPAPSDTAPETQMERDAKYILESLSAVLQETNARSPHFLKDVAKNIDVIRKQHSESVAGDAHGK